jgi:hypothetical protein
MTPVCEERTGVALVPVSRAWPAREMKERTITADHEPQGLGPSAGR